LSAATFLETFRKMGGTVFLDGHGDVVLDGSPSLLAVVRFRVDEIGMRQLAEALRCEHELAEAQG
jgi:hypothetical protein